MAKTVKQKRIEGIIRKDISNIIQYDLKDPNVGFVTITDVQVSNDHSYATIYVNFLGKEARNKAGLEALNHASGYIRTQLAQQMTIRRVPELRFVIDKTEQRGKKIDEVINQIHKNEESGTVDESLQDLIRKAN